MAVLIKRSAVAGKVPATTDLALGELAINTYDGKLYLKKNVGGVETVVDVSTSSVPVSSINSTKITATAGQTSFSVAYSIGLVFVYARGIRLIPGTDYTATNGSTVVLTQGAVAGTEYEFVTFNQFTVANAIGPAGGSIVGILNVPTAAVDDNSGKAVNTAWYNNQASSVAPADVSGSSNAIGTSMRFARADHIHKLTQTAINAAMNASGATLALGVKNAANTPLIQFNSSGITTAYDVQLSASGGSSTNGAGALLVSATGGLTCTGNVTAFSDERFKTNWRDLGPNFIQRLSKVKYGVYDRTNAKITQVGVSAQSLREVIPEAVQDDEEGQMSVAYGNAALVACIALAKEVEQLKREIKILRKGLET